MLFNGEAATPLWFRIPEQVVFIARANADAAEDIEWRSTHGKRLTLRSPQPQFLRLLKITGADALFPITDP